MAPKKTPPTAAAGAESSPSKFTWTPESELRLLYLSSIPRSIGAREHAEIAAVLGATPGAVRNRVWKIKVDHKKAYEDAGLVVPGAEGVSKIGGRSVEDGGPVKKGGKKRAADGEVEGERKKRGKVVKDEGGGGDEEEDEEERKVGVKTEVDDEDDNGHEQEYA
ncbi:hypothetical protein BU24DRAFT_452942 [Aaosphaeria arxii CBS 175.79]|uniref:Uncharacterized protein n=1 Tax=Aaosphaeria arxii CBS 175.79 TaxID=1450172 RepID=A0A6A5XI50_9PLEO|nr:uncharacterized protein BU24DRAFT_452942 [Aaosphaeria arxii CBS 175.79]KAF2012546.1 hypothetical protein BU24DRAFT_452942 [Aaosphaeria arxii CBS 175.79]